MDYVILAAPVSPLFLVRPFTKDIRAPPSDVP
nr:MAG TPA: hypothetical protein [Caudoviricetes sp.]